MGIYESRDMDRLLDDVHKDALELLINWLNNYFSDLPPSRHWRKP